MGRGSARSCRCRRRALKQGGDELRELAIELIPRTRDQPRQRFDQDSLRVAGRLAGASAACCSRCSCARKPGGTLRAGGGRAALASGADRRPAQAIPAIVREREDAQALEVALVENMAREDLNPIEEARACAALVEELGLTREEVGRRSGAAASRSAT